MTEIKQYGVTGVKRVRDKEVLSNCGTGTRQKNYALCDQGMPFGQIITEAPKAVTLLLCTLEPEYKQLPVKSREGKIVRKKNGR